jgi:nucleoside-diphosphate-sugar epimerase
MRIFMTGATGYVGGAVAAVLRERGHEVAALVRPTSDAHDLRDRGVVIIAGEIESLRDLPLNEYDAVIHTADPATTDKAAIEAFTASTAFFLYTSGVWVLGNGSADEESNVNPLPLVAWRPAHEQQVLRTGRGAVVRPGCVYGGKQSLLAPWFVAAAQKQPLKIVGDGKNSWALVDVHDAADCYARIVERRATGIFHAVDDTRSSLNDCAKAVAPDGTIDHVPSDNSPFAQALTVNQSISSAKTRRVLGWKPARTFVGSIAEQWREFSKS